MLEHKVKPGCCEVMDDFITKRILWPDNDGTVSMQVLHVPGNTDTPMEITDVIVHYCPNCGKPVSKYDLPVPNPVVIRADNALTACNDVSCRFNVNALCRFNLRSLGCYITDEAAQIAVTEYYSSLENTLNDALFV
jgi:hypothetical protein